MTLNNFLEAVAEKLVGLWPDRHVFVNEIPKDSDGNFFVGIIEATQGKKLDRRRRRHVQIEVLYFLASKDMSSDWTSNRVVRVMDGWANDVARIFGESYIGLVTNSDTGRQLFKADLVALANQYQSIDAISNFKSDDITVNQGDGKRDVAVDCALQPNDSMEKLYMTVVVN